MEHVVHLSKEIYPMEEINHVVKEYQKLTHIRVIDREQYWDCIFYACMYDEEQTAAEFENYLIDRMNLNVL